ncbi:MAG: ribonuclease P protein component 1 [Candidatus Heimdallarchaeaceae archaeon]
MNQISNKRRKFVWGILATTLCGRKVRIVRSTVKNLEGLEGEIEDETAKMLKIRVDEEIKWVPKENQILEIELPDKSKVKVEGRMLKGKPEERIKKKIRRW